MTLRSFGKRLRSFAVKYEPKVVFGPGTWVESWSAGGCYIFAKAVQRLVGKEARLFYVKSDIGVEHIVVKIGSLYFDAFGARTSKQLLRWAGGRGIGGASLLPVGKGFVRRTADSGIDAPPEYVDALVGKMKAEP